MLKERLVTAVVAVVILGIVLFVLPAGVARAVIAGVMLIAAWEWGGFLGAEGNRQRLLCVLLIAILQALIYLALQNGLLQTQLVLQLALVWWSAAFIWLFFFPTPVPSWLTWLAAALVLLPAWLALDLIYSVSPVRLLFMLVIVWAADIGAYFAGKSWGKVKLAPRVSPGKTWEGVIGGLVAVLIVSYAGAILLGAKVSAVLAFAISIALLSIVGDLTVSAFKRNAEMKDSGSLFPGHGGLLDRIDSVTAAAPLYALGMAWVGLT